jgi:hypothetical protein
MKDVVEAAGFSLRKFLLPLVERFDLARLWFFGHPRQHNPTVIARHFKLLPIAHISLRKNFSGERNSQFPAAHRGLGHIILLVSSAVAIIAPFAPPQPFSRQVARQIDFIAYNDIFIY